MRVTAIIGAGAVVELGAPSTKGLTDAVRGVSQLNSSGARTNFLERVADALRSAAGPWEPNFEDYLHAIEALYSMHWAYKPNIAWTSKPILAAFNPQIDATWLDQFLLLGARESVISTIGAAITTYMRNLDLASHVWFRDFWRTAVHQCHWDIATTNYDDTIERCLPVDAWHDGYISLDAGLYRFDPHKLADVSKSRMLHVHGSVLYGYPRFSDPSRFNFEDDHEDLYKYDDPAMARKTWFGRSTNKTQSREEALAGPLITGLRKADKTLHYPYDSYQVALYESVRQSPRLLIAGYSFGDLHLNRILQRITRLHGDNRRIVLISYGPNPALWHEDPQLMEWPDNHEMFSFIATAFQDAHPFPMQFSNPLVSRDGRAKVYFEGMRHTLEKHGMAIVSFLTS